MAVAGTIDAMKPAAVAFVAPGVAAEYGLSSPVNPHAGAPVALLPLAGIAGTALGSLAWGCLGDAIGRRPSILDRGRRVAQLGDRGPGPGAGQQHPRDGADPGAAEPAPR